MEDFSESDYSSESEQFPRMIAIPIFRVRSSSSTRTSSLVSSCAPSSNPDPLAKDFIGQVELSMESFHTSNNSRVLERTRGTRAVSLFPDSYSTESESTGPSSDESDSDSSSSSSSLDSSVFRDFIVQELSTMGYSSDSETSSLSSSDTSSSSSNSSSPSSDEPPTSMGRRRQYVPAPNEQGSDSGGSLPPSKRTRSDAGEAYNCPVCLEDVREREPVSTNCGHVFCKKCIERAIANGRMCPLCGVEPEFHRIFL
ncbi:uncharacterized protein Dere_GG21725 [Drosophila erecta]|uniref:RING-type domain-containing protein n=1 Tax=Drosophila erecta TaxID=7220 RepID=B3NME3_DROER|nr:uncharacterized protein Dere_GG21725 [Drosophila erecta]